MPYQTNNNKQKDMPNRFKISIPFSFFSSIFSGTKQKGQGKTPNHTVKPKLENKQTLGGHEAEPCSYFLLSF
jgi:hypothetical protein